MTSWTCCMNMLIIDPKGSWDKVQNRKMSKQLNILLPEPELKIEQPPDLFLEISKNSQENTCAKVFFKINFQSSVCNFIRKETKVQVFSCEFCKISKNTFFTEPLRVTASADKTLASY